MAEHEELLMLRELVSKQAQEIQAKDHDPQLHANREKTRNEKRNACGTPEDC